VLAPLDCSRFHGLTRVSFIPPEPKGANKFFTLSISRGSGTGGGEGEGLETSVSASRGAGYLYGSGPRVCVRIH
jgi:hypothetical protein